MDKENNSNVIELNKDDKKNEISYDEEKLNRFLNVFKALYDQQVDTMEFENVYEYYNMKIIIEYFAKKFYNRLLKKDKTVLPYILLMKIVDQLNNVEIQYDLTDIDPFLGPCDVPDLPSMLLEQFPSYYRKSNLHTPDEILTYFINEIDVEKYNKDVLYIITLIMFGIFLDNEDSDKYATAVEKIFNAASKFSPEELSDDFHTLFYKIVSHYIKTFVKKGIPLEEILRRVKKIKHLYGAYSPIVGFLTANDQLDLAYRYLQSILPSDLTTIREEFNQEIGLSIGLDSFLYVSLCYDKVAYFKDLFPVFLKLNSLKEEIEVLLLLFKKITSPEDYEEYINSLLNDDELSKTTKRDLRKFYRTHKTSSY